MLPREFERYGHRFRWMDAERVETASADDAIPLVRMRREFPSDAVDWLIRDQGPAFPWFGKLGNFCAYRFEGIADFLFPEDGRYLEVFLQPRTQRAALEFVMERGVLPRLLHLRGTTCLHASAIAVDGGVVAFCGQSGAGKSTLAAALVSRGFPLVTDDVLPLRADQSGDVWAGPGLPELRVYPATAELIGIDREVTPPLEGQTKASWEPRRAPGIPLPLRAIYLLEPSLRGLSLEPAMEWPRPRPETLLDLISHSFWVHPGETGALAAGMLCLGRLLRTAPVTRLVYELSEAGFAAVERLITANARARAW